MNIALLKSVMQDILGQIDHKFIDKEVEYFKVSVFSRLFFIDDPSDNLVNDLVNLRMWHRQQKISRFGSTTS